MNFISFSFLISLARVSTTVLNRSGESQYLCLDLILGQKLSMLSVILALRTEFF